MKTDTRTPTDVAEQFDSWTQSAWERHLKGLPFSPSRAERDTWRPAAKQTA